MKSVLNYDGLKFEKGSVTKVSDPLSVEHALAITINEKPFTVVMQTPGDELDLAVGLLFAEDVIGSKTPFVSSFKRNKNSIIETIDLKIEPSLLGDGYLSSRSLLSVSSCGICGKQSLDDLQIQSGQLEHDSIKTYALDELFAMQTKMYDAQVNFKTTGGCHGVAAFSETGELLAIKEDIGRHNAMDKVVGQLIQAKNLKHAKVITFSGRLSYEIVAKAFRAKIPVIMAVSAPSSLAIDFAKEYGITLLSFARNGKATCYATCERIQK